ncbi:MAG: hypothetical protein EAZ27_09135 [Cytophagales bacterium]|nr:MAG: hypothetical protein EAZ27_09135 [Cytophagales bacterium]
MMQYSKLATLNHAVSVKNPACVTNFNDLIIKEGFEGSEIVFQNDVIVLDMDCVESKNANAEKGDNLSSMDCTFAIEINKINVEMLMVEPRFNYKNLQNLDRKKLLDKVKGSTKALGNSEKINEKNVFIFNSYLKAQAKSRFSRMLPRIQDNYIAMDIFDLHNLYF